MMKSSLCSDKKCSGARGQTDGKYYGRGRYGLPMMEFNPVQYQFA